MYNPGKCRLKEGLCTNDDPPLANPLDMVSNQSQSLYSQRPIGLYQKHIRLLKFNKPVGNEFRIEHPMNFELETEPSVDASYIALSYYWGDQKDPKLRKHFNFVQPMQVLPKKLSFQEKLLREIPDASNVRRKPAPNSQEILLQRRHFWHCLIKAQPFLR
jgi:hypothetical protein